ncbi:MAG: SDR family oxidoreductase [Nitrospirae bacterium]|nr:MAG: SDR family oxidoreductase [Nitrospirota bacterium]
MELGIRQRRALITGAGRGLGRNIAECLAQEGVQIAAISRTQRDVDRLLSAIASSRGDHVGVIADLTEEDAPLRVMEELSRRSFSPIDIVVHNVGGTLGVTDPFCSLREWRRVFRLNLEIAIELNLSCIPIMQRQGWGRIVLIGSIAGMENHGPVPYCSAKAALIAYGRSLGRVLARDGIVVSVVLPGAVFTEGGYWDMASMEKPEHVREYLEKRMAIGRFGRPDEIGKMVAFLCSNHASFCIGSVIPIDGGQGRSYFGHI